MLFNAEGSTIHSYAKTMKKDFERLCLDWGVLHPLTHAPSAVEDNGSDKVQAPWETELREMHEVGFPEFTYVVDESASPSSASDGFVPKDADIAAIERYYDSQRSAFIADKANVLNRCVSSRHTQHAFSCSFMPLPALILHA